MTVLGVLGGSFDPPHCGHVLVASYALSAAPIDALLIVPTFQHAFGKRLTDYEHRVAMCERAFGMLRGVEVSRIEQRLGGASYTVRTLEALREEHPGVGLRLVVGADVVPDLPRWKDVERVLELAPLFVLGRSGYALDPGYSTVELPAISSTRVREALRAGRPVAGLVPRAVEAYCEEQELYRA